MAILLPADIPPDDHSPERVVFWSCRGLIEKLQEIDLSQMVINGEVKKQANPQWTGLFVQTSNVNYVNYIIYLDCICQKYSVKKEKI
jgi:hypothetical protein